MLRFPHHPAEPPRYAVLRFGITEALGAVIASAAVDAGVGAATAGVIGSIGAGVVLGAGSGAALAAVEGGNVGLGALTGGITGGLIPAGGIIGGDIGGTTGAAIGDVLGGAAGGAIGAGITGSNPLTGALEGGAAGGIAAATAPAATGADTPVPAGAGAQAGGVISPSAQEALQAGNVQLASAGTSDVAPSPLAGTPTQPTTALGTLAGAPTGADTTNIPLADAGTSGGALSTPGASPVPGSPDGPVPAFLSSDTGLAMGPGASATANQALAGNPGAPISTSPQPETSALLSGSAQVGNFTSPSSQTMLNAPQTGISADISGGGTPTITQGATPSSPTGTGGIGDFLSKPSTLLAAAPLALTLLRGESSLPPQYGQLQQITGPEQKTALNQLNLANAGELTPGAASSVSQYVQEATSALYQQLSSSGVTNPTGDTRYIQGLGSIAQQASVMTQGFVQQEFTNAFAAAGAASNNLIAAANAQISEDNAFTAALSSAFTSAGLLFAFSGGLKSTG